jgi:hypothetical protein
VSRHRREGYTPEEGRELTRRHAETRTKGGIPHESVRKGVLADVDKELRQMVRSYTGEARQARQILEGLMVARDLGLDCGDIEQRLAVKMRKLKRAA